MSDPTKAAYHAIMHLIEKRGQTLPRRDYAELLHEVRKATLRTLGGLRRADADDDAAESET